MITQTLKGAASIGAARGWGALATLAIACLLPLPAQALGPGCQLDPMQAGNYVQDMGLSHALGQLAPHQITLDKATPPGTIVYDQPLPPVPWVCIAAGYNTQPFLSAGGSLQSILNELHRAGLKLVVLISGLPPWEPTGNTTDDRFRLTNVTYAPKSATDRTPTAKGVLLGRMQLVVVTPPTKPLHAYFPATQDLVQLNPAFLSANHVGIGSSNDTSIDVIPSCIAKIAMASSIPLGRAYAASNLPLPPKVNFTLYADFNTSCDGGFSIADLGSLAVPLKIMFQPEDNLELASLNREIVLKGADGQPNGFTLGIKQNGVTAITFNEWHTTSTLSTAIRPLPLRYSAQLSKSGGPLATGPFSQKVTVLVTFQ
ncbi:hypothetical protein [Achromobacter ruhlandii]|uniref:hypothetical protein n=1 Tax=Achromobacter ruhlandii TaxID=72557 RepID=UPI0006C0E093|nr:hypothetical protein [Achromobacter ruhlandii]CUI84647.1 Uncharacterised protein [Achromobacter ruhlandii]CUJ18886.1 Uncharacterised protein [Achromobacter ruhlandii]CUK03072.1 Uncharacterised protein [Achromobacter ruhlandii]